MNSPEGNGDGKCGGQPAKAGIATIIGGTGGRYHAENVGMTILFCKRQTTGEESGIRLALTRKYQFNTTQYQ
ncbi:hypothetical protein GCN78_19145 [Janthinobacterium rivuli]|uniref:hypothetical protein n=1 Tax=Janthinobacterium sp. FT68W TaxID=2654255 RepID=UPI0012654B32|nr:hypothetical protein [Janthinobacterium sp. FT68W]KAB8048369.1 hypothetical protein GCN78_19145 [Janthinobacterium sp. FT68W]